MEYSYWRQVGSITFEEYIKEVEEYLGFDLPVGHWDWFVSHYEDNDPPEKAGDEYYDVLHESEYWYNG